MENLQKTHFNYWICFKGFPQEEFTLIQNVTSLTEELTVQLDIM